MIKLKTFTLKKSFLLSSVIFFTCSLYSQSLIINEFSNGPSGTQEYIELIALDTGSNNNCAPCLDIRGWIVDDNNGYHGTSGIASGCNRFSNDVFWSCIPLGTMITIYNGSDPNMDLPPDDLDINDGNCQLVIPIENTTLFETSPNTPSPVFCNYPNVGWTSGGNWSRMGMRNSGDCIRLVDLTGCEVFSLSYGDISLNSTIYFAGSGADDVFYFSGNDPYSQAEWLQGCAGDPGACLGNDQTPGSPNSNLNNDFISQYTINGCQPITPFVIDITSTDEICLNDGSATAIPSGATGTYTFNWLDASSAPIGQNTANATNLAAGIYYCAVSSSIGCMDTAQVNISNSSTSPVLSFSNQSNSCGTCEGAITIDVSSGQEPYTYSFTPNLSISQNPTSSPVSLNNLCAETYSVTITDNLGCQDNLDFTIINEEEPTITTTNNLSVCNGESVELTAVIGGSATGILWASPNGSFSEENTLNTTFTPSTNDAVAFVVATAISTNCGNIQENIFINVSPPVTPMFSQIPDQCEGELFSLNTTSLNGIEGIWSPSINNLLTTTYSFTPEIAQCANSENMTVTVIPNTLTTTNLTICNNALPYNWNGLSFNTAGSQNITLSSIETGCDSILILNLTVNPAASSTTNLTLCANELPFTWNGLTFNSPGIQNTTIPSLINGCDSIITLDLSINSLTIPVFNPISPICSGASLVLPGSSTNSISGTWSPAVNNTASTNYTFTPDAGQCATTETMTVNVNDLPSFTSELGNDPLNCGGLDGSILLSGLSASSSYDFTYNDGSSNVGPLSITTDASGSYILSSISAGSYSSFMITDGNCSYTVVPSVTLVDPSAPVFTANSVGDPSTCLGDDGVIDLTGLLSNTTYALTYLDDGVSVGPINVTSDGSGNIALNSLDAGTYTSFVMNLAGCTGSTGSSISLTDPASPDTPMAFEDAQYCSNEQADPIEAQGSSGSYTWYSDNSLTNVLSTQGSYTPPNTMGSTSYYVTATENECQGPAQMLTINFVECGITIPTAFTPDGDNVNDFWKINDLDAIYPNNVVHVYNRLGNQIYESREGTYNETPWDGRFKNKDLPVGSYYYIIEYNDGATKKTSGNVSILK